MSAIETTTPVEVTPSLSKTDIARAWTNSPSLAADEFTLGERTFKIIDLGYDEYVEFIAQLEPLLQMVVSFFSGGSGLSIPDIDISSLNASKVVKYLKAELPEMVRIICSMTDSTVTTAWVKKNCGKGGPLLLARIVLKQIMRNNMIREVADFFADLAPAIPKKSK